MYRFPRLTAIALTALTLVACVSQPTGKRVVGFPEALSAPSCETVASGDCTLRSNRGEQSRNLSE
jgi:hypothetical protein